MLPSALASSAAMNLFVDSSASQAATILSSVRPTTAALLKTGRTIEIITRVRLVAAAAEGRVVRAVHGGDLVGAALRRPAETFPHEGGGLLEDRVSRMSPRAGIRAAEHRIAQADGHLA